MNLPLSDKQQQWVEETLDGMTLSQCLGQLLIPTMPHFTPADWLALLQKVPLGALFVRQMAGDELREMLGAIQAASPVPLLVAGDLEMGAVAVATRAVATRAVVTGAVVTGTVAGEGTLFPLQMAAGAANDEALMAQMGRATAREARYAGLHWTYAPVVDLNINPQNPATNVRAFSDDPDRVIRLATALIGGFQEDGLLAATAKHFPGDGMDDRDQHLVTSINSLTVEDWWRSYGRVWRAVIEAGVMSIMVGHIAFPAYEGLEAEPQAALPATLSRRLQVDLLRGELGFAGVITSDAAGMIGIASRVPYRERAVANLEAGSDMVLFARPEEFDWLLQAARSGRLSEERIRRSARRVLEMKARLNLHHDPFAPAPTPAEKSAFQAAARAMAEKSITLLRADGRPPVRLAPGAPVLTVTVGAANPFLLPQGLAAFDAALRARGYAVTHLDNPDNEALREQMAASEAIFVNIPALPFSTMGTIRVVDNTFVPGWRALYQEHPQVLYTSFGSPYLLYEAPYLPNLVLAYGPLPASQEAAVQVWLGERVAEGEIPVCLPQVKLQPLPPRMNKATFLARLRAGRAAWEALLAQAEPAKMERPGPDGGWSLKEIMAHVTWYERQALGILEQMALTGSPHWNLPTVAERNAAVHQEIRQLPLEQVLAEGPEVYGRLLAAVEGLAEEAFNDASYFAGMPPQWQPWEVIAGNCYEHYRQHRQEVLAWLAAV